jgi:hypothetical protein
MMDYAEKREICPSAKMASDLMLVHPNEWLKMMRREQDKRCFDSRAFPNIDWDLSVYACCNIVRGGGGGVLTGNYLEVPLEKIIDLRNNSPFCTHCIENSVHRYDYGLFTDYASKLIYDAHGLPSSI